MLAVTGKRSGQKNRQVLESVVVCMPDFLSSLPIAIEARQLVDAQRCLQVHHVVFESGFHYLVMFVSFIGEAFPGIAAEPVQTECLDAGGVFVVVGDGHAPFAGDDVFGHVETVAANGAESAHLFALKFGFDGMGAILDHMEPVAAGDVRNGVHGAGPAGEVHRDDGPGFFGYFPFRILGVHVHGFTLAVDQDRPAAGVDNGIGRGGEGQSRDDDLVAGLDADGQHGQVQGRRARVERHGKTASRKIPEHFFETMYFWSGADPAGAQGGHYFGDLRLLDERTPEYQKILSARHMVYFTIFSKANDSELLDDFTYPFLVLLFQIRMHGQAAARGQRQAGRGKR